MKNNIKDATEGGKRKEEKASVFGLRSSVFGLQKMLPSIRFATQGSTLQTSDFGLQSSVSSFLNLMIFFLIATVAFSSCEDVIDVNLSDKELNLIAVEARITTVDQPAVFLYKTLHVDQDVAYPGISGADVSISDNENPAHKITLVELVSKKGLYIVPAGEKYPGIPGRVYTLSIVTGGVTITATEKLEPVEPIDSIQVRPSMRGDKLFLGVFTYGQESPGLGDYYKWDVYINDTLVHSTDRFAVASDEFVDGNYIPGLEIFTDFYDTKTPEDRMLNLNDVISVKQTSISEFAYNYYFQMINQNSTGSLFSVPPANIKSNFISSDQKPVLGLFIASDVSVSNRVDIDESIESQLKK